MHKRYWRLSSLLMAGALVVSSVNVGALDVSAAEEENVAIVTDKGEAQPETGETSGKETPVEDGEEKTGAEGETAGKTTDSDAEGEKPAEEGKASEEDKKAEEADSEVDGKESETPEQKEEAAPEQKSETLAEEDKASEDEGDGKKAEDAEEDQTPEKAVKEDKGVEKGTEEANEEGPLFADRWNPSVTVKGKVTFEKRYHEFVYDLGRDIPVDDFNSVTLKVKDQENEICIKLRDGLDENSKEMPAYGMVGKDEYKVTLDDKYEGKTVRYVAVMSLPETDKAEYPYSITITDVIVDAKEAAQSEYEKTFVFEGEDLKFSDKNEGTEVEGQTLTFDKEWREYWMSYGQSFEIEDIKNIRVTTKEPTKSLCFKVYDEANTEVTQVYGQSGKKVYNYIPSALGKTPRFAIMAMNNQDFPFDVTVEKIEVTVDTTPAELRPQKGVEYDILDLRDPVKEIMGEDFIIGTAASYDEFRDPTEMELVTKHFNGVTLGNELKPESMLKKDAELETVTLNGETFQFPKLDYSLPESRLDLFVDWNEKHPEKPIKIRGHVLVWHSQTPSFFFHEDYDTNKPLVSTEVMNKRLEYYIKSVAEHFTGEGSKYAGMFYGWDVVNEAISDGTGTYRTDAQGENSPWWGLYHSNEFITNAFVYANKYMPADVDLFYNDYNDTTPNKVKGICQLLRDVKATPGARIDGMGMQAHYQIDSNSPTMEAFKNAARAYAEIVDQVQVTELDFKGSANSTDERLANRYLDVYNTIRRLKNEGINFTGMTIWGVMDKHSWLQTANNNGGGSNGSARQYPLLFDDYYHAKNAFWAIANAGELEPEIRNITFIQNVDDNFDAGMTYEFGKDDFKAKFVPLWDNDGISVKVTVTDADAQDTDSFTVFADDGKIAAATVKRSEATEVENGYEKVVKIKLDRDALVANKVKLDVAVTNGDKTIAFGDTTLKQNESSKYYARTLVKPLLAVGKGSVTIDGDVDDAWKDAAEVALSINTGAKAEAKAKLLWDEENLYVLANVKDAVLDKEASATHEQDSIEVFIDENNEKTSAYQDDDKQYRVNYDNEQSFNGTKCVKENVTSATAKTDDGYIVEAAFKWTDITAELGAKVGLDLQINDAEAGKRIGTLNWADNSGNGWSSTEGYGTILLSEKAAKPAETEEPTAEEPGTEKPEVKPAPAVEVQKQAKAPVGKTLTYNGKEQTGVAEGEGYTLKDNKKTEAGSYTAVATLKDGYVWADGSKAEKKIAWTIAKADNTLTITAKTAKVSLKKLKKKNVKVDGKKVVVVNDAKGDVTYKKVSGNKKIKISSKTGKITVKKGLKKGTYKVKVKVAATGDNNFKDAEATVTFKVKVK